MWSVTFVRDTEIQDVGSVTATWTQGADVFSFPSERVDGKASLAGFVTRAKHALSVWQAQRAKNETLAAKIATALNA